MLNFFVEVIAVDDEGNEQRIRVPIHMLSLYTCGKVEDRQITVNIEMPTQFVFTPESSANGTPLKIWNRDRKI